MASIDMYLCAYDHTEYTGSCLITEVKQCWACSELGQVHTLD